MNPETPIQQAPSAKATTWLREALGLPTAETPFPWQEELLRRFMSGQIERSLDIPTGLGKTAVMAIWLVARACGAAVPRRLAYIVDRRAVVDQATEVAVRLRGYVAGNAEISAALSLRNRSLPISTLRGQHVDNREWLEDPSSPAIIVGTVDMIGSRLLFEGYAASRKMRPYHAGLLGADTLAVLDEAHLVPPFEKLLEAFAVDGEAFGSRSDAPRALVPPFRLLSLSATGRDLNQHSLGLQEADLVHLVVCRRLGASKRVCKKSLDGQRALADELAADAWSLSNDGALPTRCIVFTDRRTDAAAAKKSIEKLAAGDRQAGVDAVEVDIELLVGGRRVFERQEAARRLASLGFIAGGTAARARPAFVIATSAGEVGIDLDADHMVSDLVAWERMVQRLGRVHRRGDPRSDGGRHVANVIVVVEPEPKPTAAVKRAMEKPHGERSEADAKRVAAHQALIERVRALERPLDLLPQHEDGGCDASPGALRKLSQRAREDADVRGVLDAATTPAPLRPAVSRPLVDAWSMTSLREHTGRPKIDPWLRGWVDDDPQTAILWRVHLPVWQGGAASGTALRRREVETFFEAAPPHASELLETETFRVVDWLTVRAKSLAESSRFAAQPTDPALLGSGDVAAFVLSRSGDMRSALTLKELDAEDKDRQENLFRSLAGTMLVLDARIAGLRDGLLDTDEAGVPRTADDGKPWLAGDDGDDAGAPMAPVVRFRVRAVDASEPTLADALWRERTRVAVGHSEEGEAVRWLIVDKWRHDAATEEDRSMGRPQRLDEHGRWTEDRARALAGRLDLPEEYKAMLAVAARLHDEGKQARGWQRAFNAPADAVYAKTRGPMNTALLDGYRHEFGSLPIAAADPGFRELPAELQELALHLIAAHHGFARPVIGMSGCEDAPPSALEARAREVALRFARLQARWGPWGLAWWEALLRAADSQASRDNDAADPAPVGGGD